VSGHTNGKHVGHITFGTVQSGSLTVDPHESAS